LLAVGALVGEDVVRRLGRCRAGIERDREHGRQSPPAPHEAPHPCPPVDRVSISASAIRTPRPRAHTNTGLRSIAANLPAVAATKSPNRTQHSTSASTSRGAEPRKPLSSLATLRLMIAALASSAPNGGSSTAASLNTSTVTPPAPQTTSGPN